MSNDTNTINPVHAARRFAFAMELAIAAEQMMDEFRTEGCREDITNESLRIFVNFTCPANAAALIDTANDFWMFDLLVLTRRDGASRRPSDETRDLAVAIAASWV